MPDERKNELRIDPVTGRNVIISIGRGARPTDYLDKPPGVQSNTPCPFCGGNEHMTPPTISFRGRSEKDWDARSVENKFSALEKTGRFRLAHAKGPLFVGSPAVGEHEVVIETPKHGIGLADLSEEHIFGILSLFKERYDILSERHACTLVFQNFGKEAGASLSHLHAQVAAFPTVIPGIEKRLKGAKRYRTAHRRCVYCDIAKAEKKLQERVVLETENYLVICPWASAFKYETMVLPKRHVEKFNLPNLSELAGVMKRLAEAYRSHLGNFPYNYVIFAHPGLHWHLTFMPKLAIHAGIERGGESYINSTPPEDAARELREVIEKPL